MGFIMEDKDSYTIKEFEEGLLVYKKYLIIKGLYDELKKELNIPEGSKIIQLHNELGKSKYNKVFEECNKKLPKSLIDKFEIRKVESILDS